MSAWASTRIATKAIELILPIFLESLKNVDTSLLAASSTREFSKKVNDYYVYLTTEYTEAQKKLFCLRVVAALPPSRIYITNWVEYGIELLTDFGSNIRLEVAQALGQVGNGDPEVISALLQTLSDSDSNVRQAVAQALGQVGNEHPEVIEYIFNIPVNVPTNLFLQRNLDSLNEEIRQSTMLRLLMILKLLGNGDPEVIPALLRTLSASDSDVRQARVQALGQVGNGDPEVISALLQTLSDSDSDVRQAANEMLSIMPASYEISRQFLEKFLQEIEHITRKQLEADDIFDNMLNTLWQIMKERQS